jgi:hypothetical protein
MQASESAQAMIDSLWAIAEKHTPLHPEDLKRKSALVAFLDAFWHLDSETFFEMLRTARRPPAVLSGPDGNGRRFADMALKLRELM